MAEGIHVCRDGRFRCAGHTLEYNAQKPDERNGEVLWGGYPLTWGDEG